MGARVFLNSAQRATFLWPTMEARHTRHASTLEIIYENILESIVLQVDKNYNLDMGCSANFPVARDDSSSTLSVVEQIAELALPVSGPLGADIDAMRTLPPFHFPDDFCTPKADSGTANTERSAPVKTAPDGSHPVGATSSGSTPAAPADLPSATADHSHTRPEPQLEAVRMLMDECTDAVVALKKHQNQ
ncbi:hypothetical protein [Arthrobacter alpinus]|uniref:hypothetical protein n=1 Tax=Arthrobacter alpinus TaxID=656366 RepID=UPI000A9DD972|nr:hypothetical protein [Arthrobacter alpinus]